MNCHCFFPPIECMFLYLNHACTSANTFPGIVNHMHSFLSESSILPHSDLEELLEAKNTTSLVYFLLESCAHVIGKWTLANLVYWGKGPLVLRFPSDSSVEVVLGPRLEVAMYPGWSWTCEPPVSASQVLESQNHRHMLPPPSLWAFGVFFLFFFFWDVLLCNLDWPWTHSSLPVSAFQGLGL